MHDRGYRQSGGVTKQPALGKLSDLVESMHFTVANGGLGGIKETPLVVQGTGQALEYKPVLDKVKFK